MDIGMKFERVMEAYLGSNQNTTNYYWSGYYDRDRKMAIALVFSICVKEHHINFNNYSSSDISKIEEFENKLMDIETNSDKIILNVLIDCMDFLLSLKKEL